MQGKIIRTAYACSKCARIAIVEYIHWPGGYQVFESSTTEKIDDYFLDFDPPIPSGWSHEECGEIICGDCCSLL